jgi:hypothetical protein
MDAFSRGLLARMRARGVAPAFCVRELAAEGADLPIAYRVDDPMHAWVTAGFRPAWRHWPFEILVPRDAATPVPDPRPLVDLFASSAHDDATARVFLSPGCSLDHGPDALIATAAAAADDTQIIALFQHGAEAIGLRLRLECDDPAVYALVSDDLGGVQRTAPCLAGATQWEAVFPATAAARDRGFAIAIHGIPDAAGAPRRCRITALSLSVLTDAPPDRADPAR